MSYELLMSMAGIVLAVVASAFANVPVIDFVKTNLGLSGKAARFTAVLISVVMALLVMLASGQLAPDMVDSVDEVMTIIVAVGGLTEWYYRAGYKPPP